MSVPSPPQQASTNPPEALTGEPQHHVARQVLHVAWMAVALGIIVELALILFATVHGRQPLANETAADLANKISWSMIVCVSITCGAAAAKHRVTLGGLAGLLAAPAAFLVARALSKAVAEGLNASNSPDAASPLLLASVKGVEYAVLGAAVAWLKGSRGPTLWMYAGVGLAVAFVFGSVMLVVFTHAPVSPKPGVLMARALNELLLPVGCSVVQYFSYVFSQAA